MRRPPMLEVPREVDERLAGSLLTATNHTMIITFMTPSAKGERVFKGFAEQPTANM